MIYGHFNQPATVRVMVVILRVIWRMNQARRSLKKTTTSYKKKKFIINSTLIRSEWIDSKLRINNETLWQRIKRGPESFCWNRHVAVEMDVHSISCSCHYDGLILAMTKVCQQRGSFVLSSVNLDNGIVN